MKELTQYPSMRITAKQNTHLNFALANESDKTPLSNFAVIHSNSLYNLYVNYAIPTFDLPTLHIRKHRNQKNVQTVTSMLYVETHFGTAFQRCCDYVMTCVSWVNVVCLDRWLHKSEKNFFSYLSWNNRFLAPSSIPQLHQHTEKNLFHVVVGTSLLMIPSLISPIHREESFSCRSWNIIIDDSVSNFTISPTHREEPFSCRSWNIIIDGSVSNFIISPIHREEPFTRLK